MKHFLIITSLIFISVPSWASQVYETRVQTALEAIHGVGAGVGAKNTSCLLCHATSAGGPGNINASFGIDFHDRARDMGFTSNGGGSLPATGANSLETIFSDATFAGFDSDGDGDDNGTEFANNTDPADDIQSPSSGGGDGGGGGCGIISGSQSGPPSGGMLLILLLPLALAAGLRKSA